MARPIDQDRRRQLLEQTRAYAAEHGLADLSLRPLARALGTSDRMLLHYFGSKENLIGQALAAGRPDVPVLLDENTPQAVANLARRLWLDMTSGGEQEPRVRLLLQVLALAITNPNPYTEYARAAIADWVEPLSSSFRSSGMQAGEARARATAIVSGLRGLALDNYVTGDRARTTASAEVLIAMSCGVEGS